jgi:hypothetical protein
VASFPSGFLIKTLYTSFLSPDMPHPSHSSRFHHPNNTGWGIQIILYSPVTSSLLGPNILLNTLFSNTLSLRSYLNFSDQFSHSYKATGKMIVLLVVRYNIDYILYNIIFIFYIIFFHFPSKKFEFYDLSLWGRQAAAYRTALLYKCVSESHHD